MTSALHFVRGSHQWGKMTTWVPLIKTRGPVGGSFIEFIIKLPPPNKDERMAKSEDDRGVFPGSTWHLNIGRNGVPAK